MPEQETKALKSQLRADLRKRRQQISLKAQAIAAAKLAGQIAQLSFFKQAKSLALYMASDGEISAEKVLELAESNDKCCFLPKLVGSEMEFFSYKIGDRLISNRYRIQEPQYGKSVESPCELDLVLLPLVGFDNEGRRLGMGGGYYDRYFAQNVLTDKKRPKLMGLAHACQQAQRLPEASWDIPLDGIVTDEQTIIF